MVNNSTEQKEFFEFAVRLFGDKSATPQTARKWWNTFVEIIVRWCFLRGECRLPYIGVFRLIKSEREMAPIRYKEKHGQPVYESSQKFFVTFEPVDDFLDDVNMKGVSHEYRKKARNGTLTARDYLRELRAEELTKKKKWDKLLDRRCRLVQKEFIEKLEEKKKDWNKPKGNKYNN